MSDLVLEARRVADIEEAEHEVYVPDPGVVEHSYIKDPDAFYARCGANLSGPKRWVFERIVRHMMNRNVDRIRRSGSPREAAQRSSLPEMTSK